MLGKALARKLFTFKSPSTFCIGHAKWAMLMLPSFQSKKQKLLFKSYESGGPRSIF